jgi:hypothetical protein
MEILADGVRAHQKDERHIIPCPPCAHRFSTRVRRPEDAVRSR